MTLNMQYKQRKQYISTQDIAEDIHILHYHIFKLEDPMDILVISIIRKYMTIFKKKGERYYPVIIAA